MGRFSDRVEARETQFVHGDEIQALDARETQFVHGDEIQALDASYIVKHRDVENLLEALVTNDLTFQESILWDLEFLDGSRAVQEDVSGEISTFMEFFYAYFPFVFTYSAAGQLLHEFEELAQGHEVEARRRSQQAENVREMQRDESRVREKIRALFEGEWQAWDQKCLKHYKDWAGRDRTSVVGKASYCEEVSLEDLSQILDKGGKEWFSRAEEIANRTLNGYHDLRLQYSKIFSALERSRTNPKSRRYAVKKA